MWASHAGGLWITPQVNPLEVNPVTNNDVVEDLLCVLLRPIRWNRGLRCKSQRASWALPLMDRIGVTNNILCPYSSSIASLSSPIPALLFCTSRASFSGVAQTSLFYMC